jgi:hypothetical protein
MKAVDSALSVRLQVPPHGRTWARWKGSAHPVNIPPDGVGLDPTWPKATAVSGRMPKKGSAVR